MELEADVPDRASPVEAADLEHHLRAWVLGELRRLLEDRAADHHADDLLDGGVGREHRVDVLPVAHHRHPVRDDLELLEAMRDVDDPVAALAQDPGDPEQLVDLRLGERRRRLVHDQDIRVEGERLRDLHHLLLGDGQTGDAGPRVEADVELFEQLRGLAVELLLVQPEATARLAPDEDVLGHREVAHQVELLVDDRDAQVLGGSRVGTSTSTPLTLMIPPSRL